MARRDKTRKTIQQVVRRQVYARDRYICGYCGQRKKASSLAVDHIIPVRYGGYHGVENFVTSCRSCNRKKWQYGPTEQDAPRLTMHAGRKVAKLTWMAKGKQFPKRIPKISYSRV